MKIWALISVLFFCEIKSQDGFSLKNTDKEVVKFKLINNLIFIPVHINGVELNFLLDSGISETLLFSLENKKINFENIEKINFRGLGETVSVEGLKSINNRAKIGNNFVDSSQTIFIILDEKFNISQDIGIPVNGIIGYYFFKNHPIEINYLKKTITIYKDKQNIPKKIKKYREIPISVELNKAYFFADVQMKNDKISSKLLIDLGNTDSVWLFPSLIKDFVYNRPNIDDFLGRGFSGDIFGKRSRINALFVGDYKLEKPIAAMPDEYSIQHLRLVKDRKGSVGSEILRRFSIIFDYKDEKVYLKANRHLNDPFLIDGSGIEIKQDGMFWDKDEVAIQTSKTTTRGTNEINVIDNKEKFQYKFSLKPIFIVSGIRKNSAAEKSGVMKNDMLMKIDGRKTSDMSLNKIHERLKQNIGKSVKIEVMRNGVPKVFNFILEDPIPYIEN